VSGTYRFHYKQRQIFEAEEIQEDLEEDTPDQVVEKSQDQEGSYSTNQALSSNQGLHVLCQDT
jgi:hypothetical protein